MNELIAELKRRNVFRVGIAYLALAWVVIEVTGMAVPALNLPDSLNSIVFYLGLVGFPFALFFAWAFELTPDGLKRSQEVTPEDSITSETSRKLEHLVVVLLVIAVGFFAWDKFGAAPGIDAGQTTSAPAPATDIDRTIAVLPFVNMSSDQDQGWFADGLTEEILNALARTRDLLVSSRTSSFAYKGTRKDIRTIAVELGVAHVLEGSVRRGGDRIRITAQLIRAADGFHLWSETYDRDFADIIDIQEDVAINIANALQTAMDPEALADMMDAGTSSVAAFEAYLEAVALIEDLDLDPDVASRRAIAKFETAVAVDPDFARAHSRLADAWYAGLDIATMGLGPELSPAEQMARGHRHNDLAIAAFGDGIEADMRRGIRAAVELRYREAITIYERVLAADPGHEAAYANLLAIKYRTGDWAGAIAMNRRFHEISTIDANFLNAVIINYVWSFAPELASAAADHAVATYPNGGVMAYQAQRAYLMNGDIEKAAGMMKVFMAAGGSATAKMIVRIRQACATGDLTSAEALYGEMMALPGNDEATLWLAAQTLGYDDKADAFIRHLDTPGRLIELSSFLYYYHFDIDRYPNLKAVLDAQGIERPEAVPVIFGCEKWRSAQ